MRVNGEPVDLEGDITVRELLDRLGFVFPLLVVRVDGALVPRGEYDTTRVAGDADVQVLHLVSGG